MVCFGVARNKNIPISGADEIVDARDYVQGREYQGQADGDQENAEAR